MNLVIQEIFPTRFSQILVARPPLLIGLYYRTSFQHAKQQIVISVTQKSRGSPSYVGLQLTQQSRSLTQEATGPLHCLACRHGKRGSNCQGSLTDGKQEPKLPTQMCGRRNAGQAVQLQWGQLPLSTTAAGANLKKTDSFSASLPLKCFWSCPQTNCTLQCKALGAFGLGEARRQQV